MTKKPLLLADEFLLELAQDSPLPVALVAMEQKKLPAYTFPQRVEVLDRPQALAGLREGRFSSLLTSSRRGPFWDKQRPFASRVWEMRKKMRNDSLLRQYQIPAVAIKAGLPLSVVDRSDVSYIAEWNHPLLRAAKTYWFREFPTHPYHSLINTSRRFRSYSNLDINPLFRDLKKVRPISLGFSDARLPLAQPAAKKHDVFFAGTNTSPWRDHARKILQRLKAEGTYQIYLPERQLSKEEFFQACAESYLVISPAGLGWDCYRHYEAGACGSVPVMNYPTIRRYQPLLEGEHGLYYDLEEDGLERCLQRALADRPRLIGMGRKAREHVLRHHLFSNLLRTMLDDLG